jgi:hypothetical protein
VCILLTWVVFCRLGWDILSDFPILHVHSELRLRSQRGEKEEGNESCGEKRQERRQEREREEEEEERRGEEKIMKKMKSLLSSPRVPSRVAKRHWRQD